jgi:hypothetical protein
MSLWRAGPRLGSRGWARVLISRSRHQHLTDLVDGVAGGDVDPAGVCRVDVEVFGVEGIAVGEKECGVADVVWRWGEPGSDHHGHWR